MASLPGYMKLLRDGFMEKPDGLANRTKMEDGFIKQSSIAATPLVQRPVKFMINTKANYLLFQTWFFTTINRTGWFDWTDPVDGNLKQARIVGGEIQATPMNPHLADWEISFTMETWR